MIWPLLALAWVQAGAPQNLSVLDRPYRFMTDDVRDVAGKPHHFTGERRIVFRRDGGGLVAEVTLDRLATDAPDEIGRRFLIGSGGLKDRTVRFHLQADGSVASIDDQPAVWAAMLAGVAAMTANVPSGGARSPLGRDPAGAMAALPPERQRAAIASIVAGLFVAPATLPSLGSRAIRITGQTLPGAAVTLDGQETADAVGGGMRRIVTRAADARIGIARTRLVDTATGLLVSDADETTYRDGERVLGTRSSRRSLTLVP